MTKIVKHLSRKTIIQIWECCGQRWELIISPLTIKDRQDWSPHCDKCGSFGEPFNPEKWHE